MKQNWIKFQSPTQTDEFLEAALFLCKGLLAHYDQQENPYFFDHWLKTFNSSDSWLLKDGPSYQALFTIPTWKDIHKERWAFNSLICDGSIETLELPVDVNSPLSIETLYSSEILNLCQRFYQTKVHKASYVRSTHCLLSLKTIPSGVKFSPISKGDIKNVYDLLDSGYALDQGDSSYLPTLKKEIQRAAEKNSGWCFLAFINSKPIALASYLADAMPLTGIASALVADLFVLQEYRKQGIAAHLQLFAYEEMRKVGVRWIMGNIDPKNEASVNQAKKLGRIPLTQILVLNRK